MGPVGAGGALRALRFEGGDEAGQRYLDGPFRASARPRQPPLAHAHFVDRAWRSPVGTGLPAGNPPHRLRPVSWFLTLKSISCRRSGRVSPPRRLKAWRWCWRWVARRHLLPPFLARPEPSCNGHTWGFGAGRCAGPGGGDRGRGPGFQRLSRRQCPLGGRARRGQPRAQAGEP